MAYKLIDDANYAQGVNKELSPWQLPRGALANANNMLFDEPGVARVRAGSTGLTPGPTTTACTGSLGWAYSQDTTTVEELAGWDGNLGRLNRINSSTGTATALASAVGGPSPGGRPVRHFGFCFFPYTLTVSGISIRYMAAYAGESVNVSGSNGVASAAVAANNPQVTLAGADVTTNYRVGAVVTIYDGVNKLYTGRIVSIDTTKLFSVWPVPKVSTGVVPIGAIAANPAVTQYAGKCMASFQNRLLWGNTHDFGSSASVNLSVSDRRVIYSILPTETQTSLLFTGTDGAVFATGASEAPRLNYFDVPGADPIVAMEPVSDNELLILTTQGVIIFRGNLATQTATSAPGITFDISPLNTNAGCLSDLSVQKTPHGIIWASTEGIMLYTGGGRTPIDLTAGKYHTAWRALTADPPFVIHGAYYTRNHYVVSGSTNSGGDFALAFNLDNQTWAPLSGVGTQSFNGAPRPSNPTQLYIGRWWDQTTSGPTQTSGHIIRADTMFTPAAIPGGGGGIDADASVIPASITTRTMTDDQNVERILRRLDVLYELSSVGVVPTATVSVGARLDSRDTTGTPTVQIGLLSTTFPDQVAGQTNATPIVITVVPGIHGLQSGDWVDIRGVTTNSAANGRWQITVIDTTHFSLNGSKGNGATTLTGYVKKVSEMQFDCSGVDIGQGHWVTISSASSNVAGFRFFGIRMGVMEMGRGMGR